MAVVLRNLPQRCRLASKAASWLNTRPTLMSAQDFEGQKSSHLHGVIRNFMTQYTSSVVNSAQRHGCKGTLWPKARTVSNSTLRLGVPQSLWGHKVDLVPQCSNMLGCGVQQTRTVMVEVTNDDLERAIRKMKRRLKDDNGIKLLREREYYRKPSELKVLARKERDKRIAKKEFRSKLKWITNRRSRGF
ncbi:uncharacterized protein [Physcomitrium patens]|uniref:Mitochondrial ribosomal protein S21 n=1 Tax=Physcomitrium patens TaxID=3218 RepID=A0A2K1J549_PHYPA|nr:uncharacterized protein LOC112294132 [Physcomitrium patens]PNR36659.1 hypothetical protein PHYPA_022510 [Physcomitrium patens]|eukprot:XP_024400092.1 uncharacterized protein LOC112294132 [Physcomitrella patens]